MKHLRYTVGAIYTIVCDMSLRDEFQKGRDYPVIKKTIKELAIELTIETTEICDRIKGRNAYIYQLQRSCSSIGANAHEARYAQSDADFIHKMEIALKECYETEYWFEILYKTGSFTLDEYTKLNNKCGSIRRKLIASITTVKKRIEPI